MTTTNCIYKIHVFQQPVSTTGIMTYAIRSLARCEVIRVLHKRREPRFHLGAPLLVRAELWIRIGRSGLRDGTRETCACPRINNDDRVLHRRPQEKSIGALG